MTTHQVFGAALLALLSLSLGWHIPTVLKTRCPGTKLATHKGQSRRATSISFNTPAMTLDSSWIAALGEGVKLSGVELASLDGGKLRGVRAMADIDGTSPIVIVDADYAIEVANNKPPTPFPEFVTQEIWQKSLWYQRLAFKLLYEYKIERNKKIAWFEQLPKTFSTPLHWKFSDIESLHYFSLAEKIATQRGEWGRFYDSWQQSSTSKTHDDESSSIAKQISCADFIWAMECANSRAFSGVYEGSTAAERRSLLIFTGALTLAWPLLNLGTYEQSLSAALIVAFSIVARDVIFAKVAGLKRYVLCPVVDMFNHDSRCQASSDVSYNYFSNQFELRTGTGAGTGTGSKGGVGGRAEGGVGVEVGAYKAGDQVFISYGRQSNDRLLQYYGFVEEDNPFDVYDFGVGFLQLMLQYGDALADQGIQVPMILPSSSFSSSSSSSLLLPSSSLSSSPPLPSLSSSPSSSSPPPPPPSASPSTSAGKSISGSVVEGDTSTSAGAEKLDPQTRLKTIALMLRGTEVDEASYAGTKTRSSATTADKVHVRYFRSRPSSSLSTSGAMDVGFTDGSSSGSSSSDSGDSSIISIIDHFDDVTVRAMRALYCTPAEWVGLGLPTKMSSTAVRTATTRTGGDNNHQAAATAPAAAVSPSLDRLGVRLSAETELRVASAFRCIAAVELQAKPTSLVEDQQLMLKMLNPSRPHDSSDYEGGIGGKGFGDAGSKGSSDEAMIAAAGTGIGAGAGKSGRKRMRGNRSSESGAVGAAGSGDPSGVFSEASLAAIAFRIEKKKLLLQASNQ